MGANERRQIWSQPDTRHELIEGLADSGLAGEQLDAIRNVTGSQDSDLFDVLGYIAYLRTRLKRAERAGERQDTVLANCAPRQREFLDFVLDHYVSVSESESDPDNLPELLQRRYGTPTEAVSQLGSVADIRSTSHDFQRDLYRGDRQAKRDGSGVGQPRGCQPFRAHAVSASTSICTLRCRHCGSGATSQ